MANRKRRQEFSLNVGVSSILFIFVVLCLVSFAALSLASAMSDYKLSEKVKEHSENYFAACNEAEEFLNNFEDSLVAAYDSGISRTGYFEQVGKKKNFAVPVSDIQTLEVEVKVLYPENADEPFYEITQWQVVTTGDLEYDDSINVFK